MEFPLNERAKFYSGRAVTSEDVKFSLERAMRPELEFRWSPTLRRHLDRIEIVDDHHVIVHVKSPCPGLFDASWQFLGIIPKACVEKAGDAEFAKHPIGVGRFRWVDYQQDVFIRAEAVEDHYRKIPQVKTVEFEFGVDDPTLMAVFKAGEADVVQLPVTLYKEVMNDARFRVKWAKFIAAPALGFGDLAFPNESSPFHGVRVRRAISCGINRKAICEKLLQGAAEPWGDIFAPFNPGYDPNVKPFPYDPGKSKALLREAGHPNGFQTTFTYGHPAGDKIEVQATAATLAKIGIKGKIIELEAGTYMRHVFQKEDSRDIPFECSLVVGAGAPGRGFGVSHILKERRDLSYNTELDAVWKKLYALTDKEAIVTQAKELSRIWRESEIRYMLWAYHQPIGISQRAKHYTVFYPRPEWGDGKTC